MLVRDTSRLALALFAFLLAACGPGPDAGEDAASSEGAITVNLPPEAAIEDALATITEDELKEYSRIIGSDEFQGRAPSSPGEERTMEYLVEQFTALGLEPGGPDGSWFQEVPMVSITADPGMILTVEGGSGSNSFAYGPDLIAWTKRVQEQVDIQDSDLVFVGYGTIAPEYGWNDYAGLDVTGKTLVMLVNDPGFATQDPELFNGNTMTYYGRWTYKYEEAARQGAAGVLLIHETEPAAYGWSTVEGTWSGNQFGLVAEDDNMSRRRTGS